MLGRRHPGNSLQDYSVAAGTQWASGTGINVQSGGTAHTLGASFVELIAATTVDSYWIEIEFTATSAAATRTDALTNIYIGAASAEQLLIPSLASGWSQSSSADVTCPRTYGFPLLIPAGSRISAKSQALQLSKTIRVNVRLHGGGLPPFWCGRHVEVLGADTANSRGTDVTPGGASEGSFTTIGTSTYAYGYVVPMIQGNGADTTLTDKGIAMDLGVGDALYKDFEDFLFTTGSSENSANWMGSASGRWCHIPAGTALQARLQSSTTNVEALDCLIYGVY